MSGVHPIIVNWWKRCVVILYFNMFLCIWIYTSLQGASNMPILQLYGPASIHGLAHDHDYMAETHESHFLRTCKVCIHSSQQQYAREWQFYLLRDWQICFWKIFVCLTRARNYLSSPLSLSRVYFAFKFHASVQTSMQIHYHHSWFNTTYWYCRYFSSVEW